MLRFAIGNSYDQTEKTTLKEDSLTLREAFKEVGINLTHGMTVTSNAHVVNESDWDKSLKDLKIPNDALITANEKTNGAR